MKRSPDSGAMSMPRHKKYLNSSGTSPPQGILSFPLSVTKSTFFAQYSKRSPLYTTGPRMMDSEMRCAVAMSALRL